MRFLMETVFEKGSLFSSFEAESVLEARRRAHLRLSQRDVVKVHIHVPHGVDWHWLDTFSIEEETV